MKPRITRIGTNSGNQEIDLLYPELSYKIIGIAMEVHRKLGPGFLEKVYENSMMVLFERDNIPAKQQYPIPFFFDGINVGNYIADVIVADKIILELKTVDCITDVHVAQVMNYLKATGKRLGIVLNFKNSSLEQHRVVL